MYCSDVTLLYWFEAIVGAQLKAPFMAPSVCVLCLKGPISNRKASVYSLILLHSMKGMSRILDLIEISPTHEENKFNYRLNIYICEE